MVDNSTSTNVPWSDTGYGPLNPATDPNKAIRVDTIRTFLGKYGDVKGLTFGFGNFAGTAHVFDGDFGDAGDFVQYSTDVFDPGSLYTGDFIDSISNPVTSWSGFGGKSFLTNALDAFEKAGSEADTRYDQAFAAIQKMVTADESLGGGQNYSVVFMSDGEPRSTDYMPAPPEVWNPTVQDKVNYLVTTLQNAVKAANSKVAVTVSTVYFGPASDTQAISLLKNMSQAGEGQFVNTAELGGAPLQLEDVISIPNQVCVPGS